MGQASVTSAADGTWAAPNILGGVYRVRAWRAPDLAGTSSQTVFLAAAGTQMLNLTVSHFSGLRVLSSAAPNPPIIDEPTNVVVEVTGTVVGTDGYVRSQGEGQVDVQLLSDGAWAIDGEDPTVTSSSGYARWQVTCDSLGTQGLSLLVNGAQSSQVDIGPCSPVPPTTTTTTTSTTLPGHTTTTARGRGHTTTTLQ